MAMPAIAPADNLGGGAGGVGFADAGVLELELSCAEYQLTTSRSSETQRIAIDGASIMAAPLPLAIVCPLEVCTGVQDFHDSEVTREPDTTAFK